MSAEPSIIFVAGAPRSGTTLVAGLLSAGKGVRPYVPECTLLTSLLHHRLEAMRVGDDPLRNAVFAIDDETLDARYAELAAWMVANAAQGAGEAYERVVLKDPNLCFVAGELHRFFRGPIRTVWTIRDPRDVVASRLQVFERQGAGGFGDACETSVTYLKAQVAALAQPPNDANPMFAARYEDIVLDRGSSRRDLQEFCGYDLPFDDYAGLHDPVFDPQSPWFQKTLGGPVTPERVGRHAQVLTPQQILAVEDACASFMERFGYERTPGFAPLRRAEERAREAEARLRQLEAETVAREAELAARAAELEQQRLHLQDQVAAAQFETEAVRQTLEDERVAAAKRFEKIETLLASELEARKAWQNDVELGVAEKLEQAGFEVEQVRQTLEQERQAHAEAAVGFEAERSRLLQLMAEVQQRAADEAAASIRAAQAELEERLAAVELERDLAAARLSTLESKFLVRLMRPPGWSTGESAASAQVKVGGE